MPRINFGDNPEQLPEADNLDKVKILRDDQLRVVHGAPVEDTVIISGPAGPQGPTGADGGGSNYFYGMTTPGEEAITGDRWFHPGVGIEFTKIQDYWVQLYRNIKK